LFDKLCVPNSGSATTKDALDSCAVKHAPGVFLHILDGGKTGCTMKGGFLRIDNCDTTAERIVRKTTGVAWKIVWTAFSGGLGLSLYQS